MKGIIYIIQESLVKYQLSTSNAVYDGRVEWNPTKSMDTTIHRFRTAVLSRNVRAIKQIFKDVHNITPVSLHGMQNWKILWLFKKFSFLISN